MGVIFHTIMVRCGERGGTNVTPPPFMPFKHEKLQELSDWGCVSRLGEVRIWEAHEIPKYSVTMTV